MLILEISLFLQFLLTQILSDVGAGKFIAVVFYFLLTLR